MISASLYILYISGGGGKLRISRQHLPEVKEKGVLKV